jgi:hypothetical protein
MSTTEITPSVVKGLVERFHICSEAWPEYHMVGQEKRQIGFALDLYGAHEDGAAHTDPDCPECRRVLAALHVLAGWIVPKEVRPSYYPLEPYRQAISYSPARGNRPDITLTIKVVHGQGYERPVDTCEIRCLREMEERLRELGAPERRWSPRRGSQTVEGQT